MALSSLWKKRLYIAAAYVVYWALFWFLGPSESMSKFTAYVAVMLLNGLFALGYLLVNKILVKPKV
jgi:hypothetical protein